MSSSHIPDKVKLALVGRAGGRCEHPGCNKRLDLDELTALQMNRSVFAHIVADKADGPRGDPIRSPALAQSIDNLMLLCRLCRARHKRHYAARQIMPRELCQGSFLQA